MDNATKVAEALGLLGASYRGDWSDFDGRTLRSELDGLAGALTSEKDFDLDRWVFSASICRENQSWAHHCPERGKTFFSCRHLEELTDNLLVDKVSVTEQDRPSPTDSSED